MVVAGSVESFGIEVRARIAARVAEALQVGVDRLTVNLGAASVRLIIFVAATDGDEAAALVQSITNHPALSNATAASSLLDVTVTEPPLVELFTQQLLLPLPPSPPPPPAAPPPESTDSLIAIAVAALSAVSLLALLDLAWCVRRTLKQRRHRKYLALAAAQRTSGAAGGDAAEASTGNEETMPLSALELAEVGPPSPSRQGGHASPGRVRVSQSSAQDAYGRGRQLFGPSPTHHEGSNLSPGGRVRVSQSAVQDQRVSGSAGMRYFV